MPAGKLNDDVLRRARVKFDELLSGPAVKTQQATAKHPANSPAPNQFNSGKGKGKGAGKAKAPAKVHEEQPAAKKAVVHAVVPART